MKKLFVPVLLVLAGPLAICAQSQSPVEVSASYSFLREGGSGGVNANGVSGSLALNVNRWLGLAGDLGYYHASPGGISTNTTTYLFGPRFSYRRSNKVTPFAQVLLGGAHVSVPGLGSTNGFSFSAGGGLDLGLSRHVAFRPQLDYIGIRSDSDTLNTFRASFGVVFRFGD
jgi:hypothetical protein